MVSPEMTPPPTTQAPTTIISIAKLAKTYETGAPALVDVDLDIHRGEIFALLGPNGAGKTTLINIVCGIVTGVQRRSSVAGGTTSCAITARRARRSGWCRRS